MISWAFQVLNEMEMLLVVVIKFSQDHLVWNMQNKFSILFESDFFFLFFIAANLRHASSFEAFHSLTRFNLYYCFHIEKHNFNMLWNWYSENTVKIFSCTTTCITHRFIETWVTDHIYIWLLYRCWTCLHCKCKIFLS